jgi:hypothetical protein
MHPYLFRISEVRNDQTFQDYDLSDQIIVGEGIYNEKIIFSKKKYIFYQFSSHRLLNPIEAKNF